MERWRYRPDDNETERSADILMEHGIGLKNVKDVADHYLGDMDIKIKNDVFKVTVMLQQKEIN